MPIWLLSQFGFYNTYHNTPYEFLNFILLLMDKIRDIHADCEQYILVNTLIYAFKLPLECDAIAYKDDDSFL